MCQMLSITSTPPPIRLSSLSDIGMLATVTYHATMVTGLAVGYSQLTKMMIKVEVPRLDLNGYDLGMMTLDIGLAIVTKEAKV